MPLVMVLGSGSDREEDVHEHRGDRLAGGV